MTATSVHNSTPAGHPLKQKQDDVVERFLRLRDELIVRNHLAGMEMKEAAHELAREIEKLAMSFTRGLETVSALPHDAKVRMYLAYLDSDARLLEMETAVKTALAGAARSAVAVAETARVRAALARMDVQDAVGTHRHELSNEMHELEVRSAQVLDDIAARLTKLGIKTTKII